LCFSGFRSMIPGAVSISAPLPSTRPPPNGNPLADRYFNVTDVASRRFPAWKHRFYRLYFSASVVYCYIVSFITETPPPAARHQPQSKEHIP